jgi:hypothetical protein
MRARLAATHGVALHDARVGYCEAIGILGSFRNRQHHSFVK